jgi:hypothetical protein
MTDHRATSHVPPDGASAAATVPRQYGVQLNDVPDEWYAAERDAPHPESSHDPLPRHTRISAIPIKRESALVACGIAAAGGAAAGMGWYFADVLDAYSGPWTPVMAAILIAAPVRLFSKAHPTHRMVAAVVTYLLVLLASLILLTHHDLVATYDWIDDYRIYEYSVVRTRLRDPVHLVLYGLGGVLAALISRVGVRR